MQRVLASLLTIASCVSISLAHSPLRAADPSEDQIASSQPIELDPILTLAEAGRVAAIERASASTVSVFVPGGGGGGSGVLISPHGYALTNFHVTSPAGSFMRCGLNDGRVYDAVLVGLDPVGDLAMIRLLGRDDFPAAKLADSLRAKAGDWCMVIGNPFLLATNLQPTVSWGILSGVNRYQYPSGTLLEYADCLQTDASVNPGNSGGPIYNDQGELLGIIGRCSFEKRGRVNVGVGYAISINQAKNFLGYLRSGRIVDHATLGATVTTAPDGGAVVSNILESSDAYRRGLRYNAEILEIDGRPVATANDVQNVLGTFPNGWRVEVAFRYEGETKRVPIRLMSVHRQDELLTKMSSALPPPPPRPDDPEPDDSEPNEKDSEEQDPGGEQHDQEIPDDAKPDQAKPKPKNPRKKAKPAAKSKNGIPKVVSDLLIERRGFANYFFNLQEQERFIKSLRQHSPQRGVSEQNAQRPEPEGSQKAGWTILGVDQDGSDVKISISAEQLAMVAGEQALSLNRRSDQFDAIDASALAGILPALQSWRSMLEGGPNKFGETTYLGTLPLAGKRPLRDCTVAVSGDLETRWLMDLETGRPECIEVFADRDSDPAEVWITYDGDDIDTLELRYGVQSVLTVTVKQWAGTAADPS